MDRAAFVTLVTRLGDAWNAGSAEDAGACFAAVVDYADPTRYRFASREALLPFFEPAPGGHEVTWHRIIYDGATRTGVVEYTYRGHHRYHGAAFVEVDDAGLICRWREYQHLDDDREFDAFVAGLDADGVWVERPDGGRSLALFPDTVRYQALPGPALVTADGLVIRDGASFDPDVGFPGLPACPGGQVFSFGE